MVEGPEDAPESPAETLSTVAANEEKQYCSCLTSLGANMCEKHRKKVRPLLHKALPVIHDHSQPASSPVPGSDAPAGSPDSANLMVHPSCMAKENASIIFGGFRETSNICASRQSRARDHPNIPLLQPNNSSLAATRESVREQHCCRGELTRIPRGFDTYNLIKMESPNDSPGRTEYDPADPYSDCNPAEPTEWGNSYGDHPSSTDQEIRDKLKNQQISFDHCAENSDIDETDVEQYEGGYREASYQQITDNDLNNPSSGGPSTTMENYEPQQLAAHYASPIMNRKMMHGPQAIQGGIPFSQAQSPIPKDGITRPMSAFSPQPPNSALSHSYPRLLQDEGGGFPSQKLSIAPHESGHIGEDNYYNDSGFSSSKTGSAPHSHHSGSECASPTSLSQPPFPLVGNGGSIGSGGFYGVGEPRSIPQQYALYHSNHPLQEYQANSGGPGCSSCEACNMMRAPGGGGMRGGSMGPQPLGPTHPIYYAASNPQFHPNSQPHQHVPSCQFPCCGGPPPRPAQQHMMPFSQPYIIPTMPQAADMGSYSQGASLSARGVSGAQTGGFDERRFVGLTQQHLGYSRDHSSRSQYGGGIMADQSLHYSMGGGGEGSPAPPYQIHAQMRGGLQGEFSPPHIPHGHQIVTTGDYSPQLQQRQRLDSHQQPLQHHPHMLHMTRRQATEPAIVYNRRQQYSISSGDSVASEPVPPSATAAANCKPPVDPVHCPSSANSNCYTVDIVDPRSPADEEPRSRNSLTMSAAGDDNSSDRSSPDPHKNTNRYHMGAKLETTKGRTPLFGTQPDWWGENDRNQKESGERAAVRTGGTREERPMVNKSESVPAGVVDRRPISMVIDSGNSLPSDPVVGSLDSGKERASNWEAEKPAKREHIRMEIPFTDNVPARKNDKDDDLRKINKRESVGTAFTIEFDNPPKPSSRMRDSKEDKRRSLPASGEKQLPKHLAQRRSIRKYGPSSSDGIVVAQKSIPENLPVDHTSNGSQSEQKSSAPSKSSSGSAPAPSSGAKNYLLSKMLNTDNSTNAQHSSGDAGTPILHNSQTAKPDDPNDGDGNVQNHVPPNNRRSLPAGVGSAGEGPNAPARRGMVPYTRKDSEILSEAGTYTIDCEYSEAAAEAAEKQARLDIDKVFHVVGEVDEDALSDISSKTPSPPGSHGSTGGGMDAVITPSASLKGSMIRSRSPGESIGTPVDKPPTAPLPRPRPAGSQPPRGLSKLSQRSASAAVSQRQPVTSASQNAKMSNPAKPGRPPVGAGSGVGGDATDGRKGLINQLIKITSNNVNGDEEPFKPSPKSRATCDAVEKVNIRSKDDSTFSSATMASGRRSQSFVRTGSVRPSRVSAPLPTTINISPAPSPLSRNDGGRFSMRDGQGAPGARLFDQKQPVSNLVPSSAKTAPNKPHKPEMKAWLRRKGYDPLKAAAAGKKKKSPIGVSSAIRGAEPQPAFMSTRSASFHAGFSKDEDDEDAFTAGSANTGSMDLLDRDAADEENIEPANDSVFVAEYSRTVVETLAHLSDKPPSALRGEDPVVPTPDNRSAGSVENKLASLSIEPISIQNLLTISNDLALSAQSALRNLANHGVNMPEDDQILELTTSSFGDRSVSELSQSDLPCDVNLMLSQLASSKRVFNALTNHLSQSDLSTPLRSPINASQPCSSSAQTLYHPPVPSAGNANLPEQQNSQQQHSTRPPNGDSSNSAASQSRPGATSAMLQSHDNSTRGGCSGSQPAYGHPDIDSLGTLTIYRSVSPPEIDSGRSLPVSDPGYNPRGSTENSIRCESNLKMADAVKPPRLIATKSTSPSSSSESEYSREYMSPAVNYDDEIRGYAKLSNHVRDIDRPFDDFSDRTASFEKRGGTPVNCDTGASGCVSAIGEDEEIPSPPSIKLSGAIDQMKPFWQKRSAALSATKIERM